jgi:CheY-like chemotaxis protein
MNKTTGDKSTPVTFTGRIILTDSSFHITQITSPMVQLLGFDEETEPLGAHAIRDFIELAEDQFILEHSIKKFGTLNWYPVTLKCRDGRIRQADIQIIVQKNYQFIIGYEFMFKIEGDTESFERSGMSLPRPVIRTSESKTNMTAGSEPKPSIQTAPPIKKAIPAPGLLEDDSLEFVADETTNPFLTRPIDEDDAPRQPAENHSAANIVLIIDDDPAIIDVNATVLNYAGYQTVSTKSLEKGLHLLKELADRVKVILLDFSLLEMIGEENLAKIAAMSPQSAFILSSGYPSESFKELLAENHVGWLQKPYTSTQLTEAIVGQIAAKKEKTH